jgi:pteridine reductase
MTDSLPSTLPLALVTGAAHRLGKAFAVSLARRGYAIALHYNTAAEQAFSTAEKLRAFGVPVFPIQADLTDAVQIERLFSEMDAFCVAHSLSLAVLVNSAGIMSHADARSLSVADFDATLAINLRAPFFCAQYAYQRMNSGGLIVNVSDVAARKVWISFPVYTISKAALETMTKILARTFAPNVRVNAIAPGLVFAPEGFEPEDWERLVNRLPIPRAAFLDEITGALDFLLDNKYVTGQTVVVDGGYSLL